jgi:dipeptidyl aminopeptidase/acylaminoacyl peptidase
MKKLFLFPFILTLIAGCQVSSKDQQANGFEDDIPKAVPNKVSLAGSGEPDIVRFLKVQSARSPSLSPDGKKVAYTTRLTGEPQIWVTETQNLGAPRQITFGSSVTFHRWSPDGKYIIYGTDKEGNEREGYYLITPDGLSERELLPPSEAFRFFGEFNGDGSKFAYATTERNGVDSDIHLYDIRKGEDRKVFRGKLGYVPLSFSPDEKYLVLSERTGEDTNNLFLLSLSDTALSQLNDPGNPSSYSQISWKKDGSGFYLCMNHGREFTGLGFYSLATKSFEYVVSGDYDIEQAFLSADERYLHWVSNENGFSYHHTMRLDDGSRVETPSWPKGVLYLTPAKKDNTVAAFVTSPTIPGDIWVHSEKASQTRRVTLSPTAGVNMEEMVMPKPHSFKARDGITVHGLLYYPENGSVNTPLVLNLHGGPTGQSRPTFDALSQYLLKKGFAVFDLNYRGSTGYGKTYASLNNLRLRENELYDLEDAVEYLAGKNLISPGKVAVMGGSYGGYLTMAAVTRLPEVFSCGVAFVGVSNWVTALEGASPALKASDRLEYGDIDHPEDRKFFESISPIKYIDNVKAPVMVLHGANDPRDPVAESDAFVAGIRKNGGKVEYLRFPDEGHGIRKMDNRITAYVRVAQFLKEHLGPQGVAALERPLK